MAKSIMRTITAALFVVVAIAVVSSSASAQQLSASELSECNQSCVTDCVARKEVDCPNFCKEACVEVGKIMAKAATKADCPLLCYNSCVIEERTKGDKVGCAKICMKFCKVPSEAEFLARINANNIK